MASRPNSPTAPRRKSRAAADGVAGLATKSGSKVTVHFTTDMGKKTATKIEVSGDKKTS